MPKPRTRKKSPDPKLPGGAPRTPVEVRPLVARPDPAPTQVAAPVEAPTANERMITANRQTAMALAGMQGKLLKGGMQLAARIEAALSDPASEIGTREALGMLRMISNIAARTAEVSRHVVQMDQLLQGKPTGIIGHQVAGAMDPVMMTPEQAEEEFQRAAAAYRKRLARQTIVEAMVLEEETTDDASTRVDTHG